MKHINKALLAATLGSSLLALESCRKWDTNRLEGRWKLEEGTPFRNHSTTQEIIFEFTKDGSFTMERTLNIYSYYPYGYTSSVFYTEEGDWKWARGKKILVDLDAYSDDLEFEVVFIQGDDMELEDESNNDLVFKRE